MANTTLITLNLDSYDKIEYKIKNGIEANK